MKRPISAFVLLLLLIGISAQVLSARGTKPRVHASHGKCSENNDPVGLPFRGWVGSVNTGSPISGMTVQAFQSLDQQPLATAITDDAGRFSFPTLGPGRFYLRAMLKDEGAIYTADDVVTVVKGKNAIACLVADAEAPDEPSPK